MVKTVNGITVFLVFKYVLDPHLDNVRVIRGAEGEIIAERHVILELVVHFQKWYRDSHIGTVEISIDYFGVPEQ